MRLIVVRPVKYSVDQSSSPQFMLIGYIVAQDRADMLSGGVEHPDAARAGAINVALDIDLHAVRATAPRVAFHVAEQPFAAEIGQAVRLDSYRP